jgi:hypothetical protein
MIREYEDEYSSVCGEGVCYRGGGPGGKKPLLVHGVLLSCGFWVSKRGVGACRHTPFFLKASFHDYFIEGLRYGCVAPVGGKGLLRGDRINWEGRGD